jgi:hypothetical protein
LKHEPSAQIPWANTMLGFGCGDKCTPLSCDDARAKARSEALLVASVNDRSPAKGLGQHRRLQGMAEQRPVVDVEL